MALFVRSSVGGRPAVKEFEFDRCQPCKGKKSKLGKKAFCRGGYSAGQWGNMKVAVKTLVNEVLRERYSIGFYRCNLGRTGQGDCIHFTSQLGGTTFFHLTVNDAETLNAKDEYGYDINTAGQDKAVYIAIQQAIRFN